MGDPDSETKAGEADIDEMRSESDLFAATVGERVRKARERRGLTRKRLFELSGVSLRYLAQLENGGGNISVALLHRISRALGHRVEWFVSDDEVWQSMEIAEHYTGASPEVRQEVSRLLKLHYEGDDNHKRVCLIGLRGAGKSTLGLRACADLHLPFVELNTEIAALAGVRIGELIDFYGHEGYRRLERQALDQLIANTGSVILAAAGGIVSEPDTFLSLRKHFHTVWLKATPAEHMQRVREQAEEERPMVGNPKAMEQLKSVLASREVLYAQADATVNTSGRSIEQCSEELVQTIKRLIARQGADATVH